MRRLWAIGSALSWLWAASAWAHVGSPFIVFEGRAGDFPIRVVVRQPDVVPGLADISVRVLAGHPTEVRALPLHGRTDVSGAPRPDVAERVAGQTNLFTAALWFMSRGAYGVEVQVDGPGGGAAVVPINSLAHARKPMPVALAVGLAGAGLVLAFGVLAIAVAAARESTLPAGLRAEAGRRRWAAAAGVIGVLSLAGIVFGASAWWNQVDRHHNTRVLYRQLTHEVAASPAPNQPGTQMTLNITDPRFGQLPYLPIPEHGKLVHLFLVGQDAAAGVPAMAHLHPEQRGEREFGSPLPPLPAGRYRVFTELTHEEGLSQTLTNSLRLEERPTMTAPSDPDDSFAAPASGGWEVALGDGLEMRLEMAAAPPGEASRLRARVTRADGAPATLEPYLRMLGHAVVMRDDGSVFAHVHPAGSLSMAAARTFARKLGGEAGAQAADVNCGDLEAIPAQQAAALGRSGEVGFPYVFPTRGTYFVWIQVKVSGRIYTGPFRVTVS